MLSTLRVPILASTYHFPLKETKASHMALSREHENEPETPLVPEGKNVL